MPLYPDVLLSRTSEPLLEATEIVDKLDPASAHGLHMAMLMIFFIFSRWRGELQEEAESNDSSEEARECQTEESR